MASASGVVAKSLMQTVVLPVRDFHVYGAVLSERYATGFRPWGERSATKVSGVVRDAANKTPYVPYWSPRTG